MLETPHERAPSGGNRRDYHEDLLRLVSADIAALCGNGLLQRGY